MSRLMLISWQSGSRLAPSLGLRYFNVQTMTSDALLSNEDREEALSRAYVSSVASFAGYTVSEENYDRDGIDMRIHAGGLMSPAIGLQLKATTRLGELGSDGSHRYDVPVDNYRRLIRPSQVPRYLVVLSLPASSDEWLTVSADELVIRRCAYWVSLLGRQESENRHTVRIRLPSVNRFDPDALRGLLEQSRRGEDGQPTNR